MSIKEDKARVIAERVADRFSAQAHSPAPKGDSGVGADLASIRAGLRELHEKLALIEQRVLSRQRERADAETLETGRAGVQAQGFVPLTHSPWLAGVNPSAGFMPHA